MGLAIDSNGGLEIFQWRNYPKYKFAKVIIKVKGCILLSFPPQKKCYLAINKPLFCSIYVSVTEANCFGVSTDHSRTL